jgi:hypothetical protein
MKADVGRLTLLKVILHKINLSSWLKFNFHKSRLVPINISKEQSYSLASAFGYSVGSFAFTYLGLPLGLTKPLVKYYAPLI